MTNPIKSLLLTIAIIAAVAPAMAFDQTRGARNTPLAQATTAEPTKVPASYRIILDDTRKAGAVEGTNRYYGGELRILYIDGQPVRLSEREIIENIRSGRFVPVYTESGTRLSQEDWLVSLPHWLGQATHDTAAS